MVALGWDSSGRKDIGEAHLKERERGRRKERYDCVIILLFISQTMQMRAALMYFVSLARGALRLSLPSLSREVADEFEIPHRGTHEIQSRRGESKSDLERSSHLINAVGSGRFSCPDSPLQRRSLALRCHHARIHSLRE